MQSEGLYIANTILEQLGGSPAQLRLMIGARDIVALDENDRRRGGVQFGWPATRGTWNKVCVALAWNDTYTVTFYEIRGSDIKREGESRADIYADGLTPLFEQETKLTLTVPTILEVYPS